MASNSSFDVTTGVDYMEVSNAVTQATKEITQRYDFKGLKVTIELDQKEHTITLAAPDDFKLKVQGIGSTADSAREQMESAGYGGGR